MNKTEFLEELRDKMLAEGADALTAENLAYYDSYIEEQRAAGKSESEVLEELGSPSLIARSILEAAGYKVDGIPDRRPGGDAGFARDGERTFDGEERGAFHEAEDRVRGQGEAARPGGGFIRINPLSAVLIGLGILLLLILFFTGLLLLLSPFLLPILLIWLLFRLLFGRDERF